jgi:hypothetical protein
VIAYSCLLLSYIIGLVDRQHMGTHTPMWHFHSCADLWKDSNCLVPAGKVRGNRSGCDMDSEVVAVAVYVRKGDVFLRG